MEQSYENLKALLELNLLGKRREVLEELEQGASPAEVLERIQNPRPCAGGAEDKDWRETFHPEKEIEVCEKSGVRLLHWFDEEYPKLLREIFDPPLVLYIKGSFEASDVASLAIVGTRFPSIYGTEQAKRFGREIAFSGLTIVSGFAKGIDQAAHAGALEADYGRTIAVLGCGIDIDYPHGSRRLFDQISERGAMISEIALGTEPRPEFFPRRNRIISGLTLGTLVIEAALKSGSLITAHSAVEQGRDVFALPGLVGKPNSVGCHHLIKEGAALVESPLDILQALEIPLRAHFPAQPYIPVLNVAVDESTSRDAENSLLNCLSVSPLTYDELSQASGLPAPVLSSLLLVLELRRRIRRSPDGRYALFG